MKFKNKKTGLVLNATSPSTIEELKNSSEYEEAKEEKAKEDKKAK